MPINLFNFEFRIILSISEPLDLQRPRNYKNIFLVFHDKWKAWNAKNFDKWLHLSIFGQGGLDKIFGNFFKTLPITYSKNFYSEIRISLSVL